MNDQPLILVVDDTRSDAILLSRALSKEGFRVVESHDGEAAIQAAAELHPDLILLDMTMTGMDGVAVCREIRSRPETAQIPIIFVTAHSDTRNVMAAFSAGGSDYVTKPIRVKEILARVSVQLRLRAAERNLMERNAQLEELTRQLAETNAELARQSRIDGLTGLLNRRAWDEAAQIEDDRSRRHFRGYGVLIIDVDYFKRYNDSHGHPEGDRCLRLVADAIKATCRSTDILGRYGGEEFVVLTPETSGRDAFALAERIRQNVWNCCIRHPTSAAGRVTVSVGVASSDEGPLLESLRCADQRLYHAKSAGRNLVSGGRGATSMARSSDHGERAPELERDVISVVRLPVLLVVCADATRDASYRRRFAGECRLVEVTRPREARNAIAQHDPDVIVLDAASLNENAVKELLRIKSTPGMRDVPVLTLAGGSSTNAIAELFEAGADDVLPDSISDSELFARLRLMVRLSYERTDLQRSHQLRAEQVQFLLILVDLCGRISNAGAEEAILDCMISAISEVAGSRRVQVMFVDERRERFFVARSIGVAPSEVEGMMIPIEGSRLGRVLFSGEPLMINPHTYYAAALPAYEAEACGGLPVIIAPLGAAENDVGVLSVAGCVGRPRFEERDLEYVNLVASIGASAIQSFRNRRASDNARDLIVMGLLRLAECRDNDDGRHAQRVSQYSLTLARTLRERGAFSGAIDDEFLRRLQRAAPLHDIGNASIPDGILMKPSRLTLKEMEIMRTHVNAGEETLRPIVGKISDADFLTMALDIIRAHHEWYDGSGYPNGLRGDGIPLPARIVALADVYDALTSVRVYKERMSVAEAEATILELSGVQFDPAIVDGFVHCKDRLAQIAATLANTDDSNSAAASTPSAPAPCVPEFIS